MNSSINQMIEDLKGIGIEYTSYPDKESLYFFMTRVNLWAQTNYICAKGDERIKMLNVYTTTHSIIKKLERD